LQKQHIVAGRTLSIFLSAGASGASIEWYSESFIFTVSEGGS
jgi:hypothetical protein